MTLAVSCGKSYDIKGGRPGDLMKYFVFADCVSLPTNWTLEGGAYVGQKGEIDMEVVLDSQERVISFSWANQGVVHCKGNFNYHNGIRTGTIYKGFGTPDPRTDGSWKVITFHADGSITGVGTYEEKGVEMRSVYAENGFEKFEIARLKELTDRITVTSDSESTMTKVDFHSAARMKYYEVEVFNDEGIWDAFMLICEDSQMQFEVVIPPTGGTLRYRNPNPVGPWFSMPIPAPVDGKVEIIEGG